MGRPKALLPVEGEAFAARLIRVFTEAGIRPVLVLGYGAEEIRTALGGAPAQIVVNPDPSRGQLSSLQAGLAAVPEGVRGIFFHPIDVPAVSGSTIRSLTGALEGTGEATVLFVPSCGGRHGHPVLMRPALRDEFLRLAPTASAREVVHAYRGRTLYVETGDAGILKDIDTPAEYDAWRAEVAQ